MYSDFFNPSEKVVEANNNIVLPYDPIFASLNFLRHGESSSLQTIQSKSAVIIDSKNKVKELTKEYRPHDTELSHIKAESQVFNFKNECAVIAYNEELKLNQNEVLPSASTYVNSEVPKQLTISLDQDFIIGTNQNEGLRNNSKVQTLADPASAIATQDDLNSLFIDVMLTLEASASTTSDNMLFYLVGSAFRRLLAKNSGDNSDILGRLPISANNIVIVPSFIDNVVDLGLAAGINSSIIAVSTSHVRSHIGFEPKILDTDVNRERKYTWWHYARSTIGVECTLQDGIVVSNFEAA